MNSFNQTAFDAAVQIAVAALKNSDIRNACKDTGKHVAEFFEEIYKGINEVTNNAK